MPEIQELKAAARCLDRHYIPPRYPNAYAAGSPFEFYDESTAREAIDAAGKVLKFVNMKRAKL
jgi:HEPN domain-containing protein